MSTETKYVKITKASSPALWYNDYIGRIYPVEQHRHHDNNWALFSQLNYTILKSDCELVNIRTMKQDVTLLAPIQQTEDQKKHLLYLSNFLDVQGHRSKAVELRVAFPEVFMAPRTYTPGQRFIVGDNEYILTKNRFTWRFYDCNTGLASGAPFETVAAIGGLSEDNILYMTNKVEFRLIE